MKLKLESTKIQEFFAKSQQLMSIPPREMQNFLEPLNVLEQIACKRPQNFFIFCRENTEIVDILHSLMLSNIKELTLKGIKLLTYYYTEPPKSQGN